MRITYVLLLIFVLLFAGCTAQPPMDNVDDMAHDSMDDMDHEMTTHDGCHPEDLDEDGNCLLAKDGEKNVELFEASGDVKSEEITFKSATGLVVRPTQEGNYPGVVMIHEWWGLNDNIKDMAYQLAQEGYVVFAVDMYGEVADEAGKARELSSAVRENQDEATRQLRDAVEYLRQSADKVGSIGWCFGGGQSLNLALSGEEMDATVIYYGHLHYENEQLGSLQWPVLGIFGEEDTGIPVEDVEAFDAAINALGVDNEIHIYPGVGHAFANPSGSRYAPDETKDAWEKTLTFFERSLKETNLETAEEAPEETSVLPEGDYTLVKEASTLTYEAARLIAQPHSGTVDIIGGKLVKKDDMWSGTFVMDMDTITDSQNSARYLEHIKSEDFFNTARYPESKITITTITEEGDSFKVVGDLTILDSTNQISFPAQAKLEDSKLQVTADFEIDRTKWGITYDSASIFSELGDRAIKDEIKFTLDLEFVVN